MYGMSKAKSVIAICVRYALTATLNSLFVHFASNAYVLSGAVNKSPNTRIFPDDFYVGK